MKKSKKILLIALTLSLTAVLCCLMLSVFAQDNNEPEEIMTETEDKYGFNKNIMISIFWPPTTEYVNDEQYKYIADAGITHVMGSGDAIGSKATQIKMLELCEKYGLTLTVGDDRFGGNLLGCTAAKINKMVAEYSEYSAAAGYYILDEPMNANPFISAYIALKNANPQGYMHLNFLPYGCYDSVETYMSQMNDWCKLCENAGYPQDYLMYDLYPYGDGGGMNFDGFIANLDSVRRVGLRNNVKTATYIQSVRIPGAYRSPTEAETRYEINMALAFGIKQLSYFTWFTPHDRSEPFENGIISVDGVPNDKYEWISTINHEVLQIGKTLINCESKEVYFSRFKAQSVSKIPGDFFLQNDCTVNYTVAYLRDKNTGRNYCMIVNNDYNKDRTVKVKFAEAITGLQMVSRLNGELVPVTLGEGNTLSIEMSAGEGVLYALPEDYDYEAGKTVAEPDAKTNLALNAEVMCDSSVGEGGWYMDNLTDGKRFGTDGGWKSNGTETAQITVDLGTVRAFNRIDLYPAGDALSYGNNMPADFTVKYSKNGTDWYTVAAAEGFTVHRDNVPSLNFKEVKGRYIRIEVTKFNGDCVSLCEIEVYRDDGTIGLPEYISDSLPVRGEAVLEYDPSAYLTTGKKVTVSSTAPENPYRQWNYSVDFVCDGVIDNKGWTSNVKLHMDDANVEEYVSVDLGDTFLIDKVLIAPNGCWPVDFEVRVSTDGKVWEAVISETDSQKPATVYEKKLENPAVARYVMLIGTKLTRTAADGYMLQINEFAVSGRPYVDTSEVAVMMEKFTTAGGDAGCAEYKAVADALNNTSITQSAVDKLMKDMLALVGLVLPERGEGDIFLGYDINYGPFADTEPPETTDTEEITETSAVTTEPVITTDEQPDVTTTGESRTDTQTEPQTTETTEITSAVTRAPSDSSNTSTPVTTDSEADKGCGAALAGIAAVSSVACAAVIIKKKKDSEN